MASLKGLGSNRLFLPLEPSIATFKERVIAMEREGEVGEREGEV